MDGIKGLDSALTIWQCADFSHWPLEVLQQNNAITPINIFPKNCNTKINSIWTADRTVTWIQFHIKSFYFRFFCHLQARISQEEIFLVPLSLSSFSLDVSRHVSKCRSPIYQMHGLIGSDNTAHTAGPIKTEVRNFFGVCTGWMDSLTDEKIQTYLEAFSHRLLQNKKKANCFCSLWSYIFCHSKIFNTHRDDLKIKTLAVDWMKAPHCFNKSTRQIKTLRLPLIKAEAGAAASSSNKVHREALNKTLQSWEKKLKNRKQGER